jgi:hypothetical protein
MSDLLGRLIPGLDPLAGTFTLPIWTAGALAALFVVFCMLAFDRAGREGLIGALARFSLVLIGVAVTWFVLAARQDAGADRRALAARVSTLAVRATAPGSPLACLDANAGDAVVRACERALFWTPEAAAAAVSYVAAQLDLFSDLSALVRRGDAGAESMLAALRRSIEADRFGLVAHVLATRDGCTVEQCPATALMRDAKRVNDNLAQRAYELYVARYAAAWPVASPRPVAQGMPSVAPGLPPSASAFAARPPGPDVFFPSAASIPPVNIMTAEPPAEPETTGSAPARTPTPPPRRAAPAAPQSKAPPMDLNAAARGAAAPAAQ